jgi:hypothetical protein
VGGLLRALRRWTDETGDAWVLGVVRAVVGVLLFKEALAAAEAVIATGYFGDQFHLSFLPERFVPSRSVYLAVVAARILLAVLVTVGHRSRVALGASAALGVYTLLCDRIGFHHSRYELYTYAFLLALTPCNRSLAIAKDEPTAPAPLWAQRLTQLQVSIVYLASGGSKLFDADWREGLVLADRFARYGHQAVAHGVPQSIVDVFCAPDATSALAKLAVATELFLAFGLVLPSSRTFALWWGTMFHLTVHATSQLESVTWLPLVMYALFARPDTGARKLFYDPSRLRGRTYARLVRALDWLARFEVKPWAPDALKKGHVLVVVRRDATRATGVRALAMFARTLPLLFPLWAPLALLASFTKGGDADVDA